MHSGTLKINSLITAILFTVLFLFSFIFLTTNVGATPTSESDILAVSGADRPTKGVMLNAKYIEVNIGETAYIFSDKNQYDGTHEYAIEGSDCYGTITFNSRSDGPATFAPEAVAKIDVDYKQSNGGCTNTDPGVLDILLDARFADVWAEYTNASEIKFYDQDGNAGAPYAPVTDVAATLAGTLWARGDKSSCNNLLVVSPSKLTFKLIRLEERSGGGDGLDQLPPDIANIVSSYFPESCEIKDVTPYSTDTTKVNGVWTPPDYIIGNPQVVDATATDGPVSTNTVDTVTVNGAEESESCEDNDGEFVFFQCAIIRFASEAINEMDSRVRNALEINPSYYEDEGLQGAWANFRNIAYLLLIPALLLMVIGTALGFSFVDAYTVKRALPRLLVAIIFIALSYEICVLLINIVDMIGKGIGGLIAAPFGGSDELTLTNIFNPSALSGATALGVGVVGGIAIVGAGAVSLGILASYLLVAGLALIIIFALLTMREVIIVFLIILAPIAMVSWIFPNNDKMWKLWWNSFSKLLILYPIIIGLLVVGRAFALIIGEIPAEGTEAVFLTFAKLVAYIGPFFFIPTIFRYAGGAFANLAGLVNNRGKGVFDRQRKYRGENRKETMHRAKEGNRFKNKNAFTKRFNKVAEYGLNAGEAGLNPRNMRANMSAALNRDSHNDATKFMKENETASQFFADDVVTKASLRSDSFKGVAQALRDTGDARFQDEAVVQQTAALVMKAKKEAGTEVYNKAAVRALAPTGTAFADSGEMLEMINAVYGSDRQGAGAAAMEMKSAMMGAGRVDVGGAGAGATLGTLGQMYSGAVTRDQATRAMTNSVLDTQPASTLIHPSMKSDYVENNIIPVMQERLRNAAASGDHTRYMQEIASADKLHQSLMQTNPTLGGLVGTQVMGMEIMEPAGYGSIHGRRTNPDGSLGPVSPRITVRQATEAYSSDDTYKNYIKTYASAAERPPEGTGPPGGPTTPPATTTPTVRP